MTIVASKYSGASLGAIVPFIAACGAAPADEEDVEQVTEAQQVSCPIWARAAWNGGKIRMGSVDTDFCWLTKAAGRFDGTKGQSGADVVARNNDRGWWLETHGAEELAEATCVPYSCFSGDGVNDTVFSSGFWGLNFSAFANRSGASCHAATAMPTFPADSATVLQSWPHTGGAAGTTDGGGEATFVVQSFTPFGTSVVSANDCAYEGGMGLPIFAHADSLFVGTPGSGQVANFMHVGAFTQQNFTVALARTDEAICYFTKIQGKFRGGGEMALLFMGPDQFGVQRWHLRTTKGSASSFVRAEAQCFPFRQPHL